MAKNQTKTKSRPKKTPSAPGLRGPLLSAETTPGKTYVSVGSEVRNDEHGCFWGDAAVVQNIPTADRAELARHLVAVAGNLLSTVGDPIAGATIVILTRRADG